MSNRLLWVAAAVSVCGLALLVWTFGRAQSTRPPFSLESDVTYARVGSTTLKLDLALPTEDRPRFPAVVCLHGGGWVGGDRKQMARTIEVLARRGYVAVAPDYRVAPHRFPACLEDCKTALRWLRGNAGKYRVDTSRIGAVGLSAGAHLACLLGMTEPADGFDGGSYLDQSSRVQAVVSFSGPTDLTDKALYQPDILTGNLVPLLGALPTEKPEAYRKASPIHYAPQKPPPFLLVHGSADRAVPVQQAQALADKLKRQGGSVRVLVLENEGHTWSGPSLLKSIDAMLTFLDETLQP
jgi:acetyl esterase/lipase